MLWRRRRRRSFRSEVHGSAPRQCRTEAPRPCGDHHGWKRPLGEGARAAAGRGPQARGRGGPAHGDGRSRARYRVSDPLRLLLRELEASAGGNRRSHGPSQALSRQRDRGAASEGRAAQGHRPKEPAAGRYRAADRACGAAHRREPATQSHRCAQLWRPGRDRRGGPAHRRGGARRAARSRPGG